MIKRFIYITLALIIFYLVFRNADVFKEIIKTMTDAFGKSFRAVTEVGEFK